jgi:hypothetical protein
MPEQRNPFVRGQTIRFGPALHFSFAIQVVARETKVHPSGLRWAVSHTERIGIW